RGVFALPAISVQGEGEGRSECSIPESKFLELASAWEGKAQDAESSDGSKQQALRQAAADLRSLLKGKTVCPVCRGRGRISVKEHAEKCTYSVEGLREQV